MDEVSEPYRAEVLAMLATYGERRPEEVPESVDSLELAWLIHQIEERYGKPFDADDDTLARMTTVSGACAVLGELGYVADNASARRAAPDNTVADNAGARRAALDNTEVAG